MNDQTAFAEFLTEKRSGKGQTLLDVSTATGLSRTYIWGLEHGRHVPNLLIAGKLADAYDSDIQTLYNLLMKDEVHYDSFRSGKARKQTTF